MGNYRNFKLVYYFVAMGTARAEREKLEKDLAFFEKYLRADKVYLEPYRGSVTADEAHVELCREIFREHGVEVAGGLTTIGTPFEDMAAICVRILLHRIGQPFGPPQQVAIKPSLIIRATT